MSVANKVQHIAAAAEVTVAAMEQLVSIIKTARVDAKSKELLYRNQLLTSEYLHSVTHEFLTEHGYQTPEDPAVIIGNGVSTAEPHFAGAGVLLAHEPIVIDIYPQSIETSYFADMTRTLVKGEPGKRLQDMYRSVERAKSRSQALVKAGVACKDLYQCAAESLLADGFDVGDRGFIHSLGHGVSQQVHDAPKISASSTDVLAIGDVITIEPGLYYEDIGGVRLEDTLVVTELGYDSLTQYDVDWIM